jgi:hypothetical protein
MGNDMRLLIATILLSIACTAANAVVVTFDDVPQPYNGCAGPDDCDDPLHETYVTSHGFSFGSPTPIPNNGYWQGYVPYVGDYFSATYQDEYWGFTVWRQDGKLFDLESLDVRTRSAIIWEDGIYAERSNSKIEAYAADGSMIASWSSDSLNTQVLDWYSIDFDSEWTNISRLEFKLPDTDWAPVDPWYGDDIRVDNFTATVVPVPAAVWLFLSGLSVLGFRRRLR